VVFVQTVRAIFVSICAALWTMTDQTLNLVERVSQVLNSQV